MPNPRFILAASEGDKINSSIVLPSYIHDVAKVQMWCAFAEIVLGEVQLATPGMAARLERA